ncbi:MAG: MFS transporter [Candidatus Firestonebacteria bacterium]
MYDERTKIINFSIFSFAYFFILSSTGAFQQFLIPYLINNIKLSAEQASLILAVVYFSFFAFRILISYLIYYLGDYWALFLGGLTYFIFTVSLLFVGNFWGLMFMAIIWGLGAALMWTTSTTLLLDMGDLKKEHGFLMSLFYGAGRFGFAIGIIFIGILIAYIGIRKTIAVNSIITGIGVLSFLFLSNTDKSQREKPDIKKIFEIIISPQAVTVGLVLFFSSISFGLCLGFFSKYISIKYGIANIAGITIFFHLMRAFLTTFSSLIADRFRKNTILYVSFIFSAIGLIFCVLLQGVIGLIVGLFLLSFTAIIEPISIAIIGEISESKNRHLAIGSIFAWRDLGIALSIVMAQFFESIFKNMEISLLLFSMLFILCAILSRRAKEFKRI